MATDLTVAVCTLPIGGSGDDDEDTLINEAAEVGQRVAVVTATDADSGHNAVVSYRIVHGDRQGQFSVDRATGVISVARSLDREMVSSYVLEVVATDAGTPVQKSSTVLVHVDISDANDIRRYWYPQSP